MKVYRADQLENLEEAERPAGSDALENPVRDILAQVGEDANRDGLLRTPARVAQ